MFQKKNQKILSKKIKKNQKILQKNIKKKKIFCSLLFEQSYHKVFFLSSYILP